MVIKRIKYVVLSICILLFGAAIIIYPERYVASCFEGFVLWAECVLPSLFPFIVLALIFIKTGLADKASLPLKKATRILNLPQSAAVCFLLSICSGYPAGSRMVAEFYENGVLTKSDCDKLAPLCSTSGPLFIIGSVGFKMFDDKLLGMKIFIAHALAVTVFSLIYCRFCKKTSALPPKPIKSNGNLLYDTFYGAVVSVAVAGGFIAFFYVVAQFLQDFNVLYPLESFLKLFIEDGAAKAVCLGLAEATTGCRHLAGSTSQIKGALAGFIITFGGVSILMQQISYLSKTGVKPFKFISFKFLQAVLCFLILLLIG
ncbi:MAG: hypothetical protein J1F61_01805 [Clostridiales bacterium]|nr:hypothetical protein [Clostridiales bacterium]